MTMVETRETVEPLVVPPTDWRLELGLDERTVADIRGRLSQVEVAREKTREAAEASRGITVEEWQLFNAWASRADRATDPEAARFHAIDQVTNDRWALDSLLHPMKRYGIYAAEVIARDGAPGTFVVGHSKYHLVDGRRGTYLLRENYDTDPVVEGGVATSYTVLNQDGAVPYDLGHLHTRLRLPQLEDYAHFLEDLIDHED